MKQSSDEIYIQVEGVIYDPFADLNPKKRFLNLEILDDLNNSSNDTEAFNIIIMHEHNERGAANFRVKL